MTRGVKFIAAAGLFLVLGFISCLSLEARQFEPGKFVAIGDTFDLTGDLRTEIINNQEIRIIENETNKIVYSRIYNNNEKFPIPRFSPDGKTLYLLWQRQNCRPGEICDTIEFIDIYNSRLIRQFESKYGNTEHVQFSRCSNIGYVSIASPSADKLSITYYLVDLKHPSQITLKEGTISTKCAPPSADITSDAKNLRLSTCDAGDIVIFPLPTVAIPNDPAPPTPAVSIIPEGIIEGSQVSQLFKGLTFLAKSFLSKIIQPANFPIIKYAVKVIGADKRPIVGLGAGNFQIREDNASQSLEKVEFQTTEAPIAFALCLDTSGSISDAELKQINSVAAKFIDLFGSDDRGAIFKFASTVKLIQGFTSDKNALKSAINASAPERGRTSLYDAIYDAVSGAQAEANRKVIVILTDGYDNDSGHSLEQVVSHSLASNVPVFTIGLGSPLNVSLLQKIAYECRGIYFHALAPDKLEQAFSKAAEDIRSRYILTYTSANPAKDGSTRAVETTITVGGNSANTSFQYRAPQGKKPVAQIISISPNPASVGQSVTFQGIGVDSDGAISEYSWRSSIAGVIGNQQTFQSANLSQGDHIIYFKVKDSDGLWSDEVSASLAVSSIITVSGKVRYENRIFNEIGQGSPNTIEFKPVRFADFAIISASDSTTVLGDGETDGDGDFTIQVKAKIGDTLLLRCYARQDNPDYNIVINDQIGQGHKISSGQIPISANTATINLDIVEASGEGGAFNIFDCLIEGTKKVKELSGSAPPLITVNWQKGISLGTAYNNNTIELNGASADPDEYDDAVILHEYGHFVMDKYSSDKSPGGSHQPKDTNQDIRLSWSEGWATYFSGVVKNISLYIDTGRIGTSENTTLNIENLDYYNPIDGFRSLNDTAIGQDTEAAVSSILWDIFDSADDDGDALTLSAQPIWEAFVGIRSFPDNVLEDFYSIFLTNPANESYRTQIDNIFASRKVFYSDTTFKRGKLYTKSEGISIPDGDSKGIISELEVSDDLLIKDINLFLDLPHKRRSDLLVSLLSPAGKEVILHNHSPISSGLSESVFVWYQEPYETIPHQALDGNFSLAKSKGKWKLKVIDNLNSDILGPDNQTIDDSGALNLWKIEIKGQPAGLELQLQPGWNFFSLPFKVPEAKIASVFSSISAKFDQVTRYNSQAKKFEHYVADSRYNQFDVFEYGKGYQVYITDASSVSLVLTGEPPLPRVVSLKANWNLIGSPKLEELPVEEALKPLQLGVDYSKVSRYNPLTKSFENYSQDQKEFTTFRPGEGYYIKCLRDTNWTVEPE